MPSRRTQVCGGPLPHVLVPARTSLPQGQAWRQLWLMPMPPTALVLACGVEGAPAQDAFHPTYQHPAYRAQGGVARFCACLAPDFKPAAPRQAVYSSGRHLPTHAPRRRASQVRGVALGAVGPAGAALQPAVPPAGEAHSERRILPCQRRERQRQQPGGSGASRGAAATQRLLLAPVAAEQHRSCSCP